MDEHEVVVDVSSLNKGTLALRGQGIHERSQTQCQDLGYYLRKGVNKANGPIALDRVHTLLFRDQNNCRLIKEVEIGAPVVVNCVRSSHDVLLDDRPAFFEEEP